MRRRGENGSHSPTNRDRPKSKPEEIHLDPWLDLKSFQFPQIKELYATMGDRASYFVLVIEQAAAAAAAIVLVNFPPNTSLNTMKSILGKKSIQQSPKHVLFPGCNVTLITQSNISNQVSGTH